MADEVKEARGFYPPFLKGGKGGLNNHLIIPLNPPLGKGDLDFPILALGADFVPCILHEAPYL
jgi:hypothetical protein